MPTNNKTSLGLNCWVGTDKPKRSDFVEDNTLLNNLLTGHFGNTAAHLSADDRTLLTQNFVIGGYRGDGKGTQEITLPFEAKMVLVFLERASMNDFVPNPGYNENNFSIVTKQGGSAGVFLDNNKLTVCQTQRTPSNGGILYNFNKDTSNYVYIAFR